MATPPFTWISPPSGFLSNADLYVVLDVPATAQAGTTLRYRVVLSADNGLGAYIEPPLYRQYLGTTAPTFDAFELRWDSMARAGALSLTFDMELEIPADTPPGPITLTWQPADPPHVPVEGHVLAGKQRRESSGGKLPPLKKRPYGNLPQGPTRDQIGAAIGISGKTYERVDPKTLMEIYHQ